MEKDLKKKQNNKLYLVDALYFSVFMTGLKVIEICFFGLEISLFKTIIWLLIGFGLYFLCYWGLSKLFFKKDRICAPSIKNSKFILLFAFGASICVVLVEYYLIKKPFESIQQIFLFFLVFYVFLNFVLFFYKWLLKKII